MILCELLSVSMMDLPAGVEKIQLVAHADDGTACLPIDEGVILLPVEVQVSDHMICEVLLQGCEK